MTTSLVRTRYADADDVAAVQGLYDRCSPQTLEHRFHMPVRSVSPTVVGELLSPRRGWSLLAEQGEEVVGHGCAGETSPEQVEIGLLVDDAFQGTGVGSRLMRDLAATAAERGYRSLVCCVAPDNQSVLPTVRRAGLPHVSAYVDGVVEIVVPLLEHPARLQEPA
jgi:ribosomal protein S18 acetylase RimI-like enzyme